MKLNRMTFEFNVDRFYAQLGAFSIFTISHIREMKPGSNWIPWPMNLMLKDFTPNWALFLFSLFHTKEGSKSQKKGRVWCHLDDTALSSFYFLFLICADNLIWNIKTRLRIILVFLYKKVTSVTTPCRLKKSAVHWYKIFNNEYSFIDFKSYLKMLSNTKYMLE